MAQNPLAQTYFDKLSEANARIFALENTVDELQGQLAQQAQAGDASGHLQRQLDLQNTLCREQEGLIKRLEQSLARERNRKAESRNVHSVVKGKPPVEDEDQDDEEPVVPRPIKRSVICVDTSTGPQLTLQAASDPHQSLL
jgi:hypothetical protein